MAMEWQSCEEYVIFSIADTKRLCVGLEALNLCRQLATFVIRLLKDGFPVISMNYHMIDGT